MAVGVMVGVAVAVDVAVGVEVGKGVMVGVTDGSATCVRSYSAMAVAAASSWLGAQATLSAIADKKTTTMPILVMG